MFNWRHFFDELSRYYYTSLLTLVVEFIVLIISIIHGRKSKIGSIFISYIMFDFLISITDFILGSYKGVSQKFFNSFLEYSNTLIGLVEILVYYYFIGMVLQNKKITLLMKTLATFYTILVIVFFINRFDFITNRDSYIASILGGIEFILLLPPCIFYFYTLLHNKSEMSLFDRPSFWIVTGIFLFAFISIPYYLINRYIHINNKEFWFALTAALYYIPITLNFTLLIKAFLCKRPLTI